MLPAVTFGFKKDLKSCLLLLAVLSCLIDDVLHSCLLERPCYDCL